MARLYAHVTLNSIKDAEFVDEVGDGQLLHCILFLLTTKCKVAQKRLAVRRRSTC